MEEQTGKIFLAVFLAVLLAGAILLYLIPIMQEEREEQQREEEELQKVAHEVMERREEREKEAEREAFWDSVSGIEIDVQETSEGLTVKPYFVNIFGREVNWGNFFSELSFNVEIYTSVPSEEQRKIVYEECGWVCGPYWRDCIDDNRFYLYGDYESIRYDEEISVSLLDGSLHRPLDEKDLRCFIENGVFKESDSATMKVYYRKHLAGYKKDITIGSLLVNSSKN